MVYYVYKITHLPSGRFYIGKHEANSLHNQYKGSGIYVKRLLKKYSEDQFSKEILKECSSREELNASEKEIISAYYEHPLNINFAPGGSGGPVLEGMKKREPERYKKYCKDHARKTEEMFKDPEFREKHSNGLKKMWKHFREERPEDYAEFRKEVSLRMSKTMKEVNADPQRKLEAMEKTKATMIEKHGTYEKAIAARTEKFRQTISTSEAYKKARKEHGKKLSESVRRKKEENPEAYAAAIERRRQGILATYERKRKEKALGGSRTS